MVFASLIFTVLLSVTIWILTSSANIFTLGVSAIWELITRNCGMRCRQNHSTGKGQLDQESANSRERTTFIDAKRAIEQANRRNQAQGSAQQTARQSPDPAMGAGPVAVRTAASDGVTNVGNENCTCEKCPCKMIEDAVSNIKPVQRAYRDLAEEIRNSYVFVLLRDFCNQIIMTYPAAIEHLEDYDKIDSEENFYFLSSDTPNQKRALSRYVDVKIRSSPVKIIPSVGPSTPSESKPPTPPKSSKTEPPPSPNKSTAPASPNKSTAPASPNKSTAPASPTESTSKGKKRFFHYDKKTKDPLEVGTSSKATSTKSASSCKSTTPKAPQSAESLEKDIKEFLRTGPPQRAPLYICPSCKAKGLTCVRGCPNEHRGDPKEPDTK